MTTNDSGIVTLYDLINTLKTLPHRLHVRINPAHQIG